MANTVALGWRNSAAWQFPSGEALPEDLLGYESCLESPNTVTRPKQRHEIIFP